jgi:hypothetical protein
MYSSSNIFRLNISRRIRSGHAGHMGELRGSYWVFVWTLKGKSPLGRPRRRWEDNSKKDFQELGYGGMDWIDLAQERNSWRALANAVGAFQVS